MVVDVPLLAESRHLVLTTDFIIKVSIILEVPPPIFTNDPPQDSELGRRSTISRHCLQIEICGPNFVPLSIIDTPGLYHSKVHSLICLTIS